MEEYKRLEMRDNHEPYSSLIDELNFLDTPTCEIISPDHLAWDLDIDGSEFPIIISPLIANSTYGRVYGGDGFIPEKAFVFSNTFVLADSLYGPHNDIEHSSRYLRGGSRKNLFFKPIETQACIVTAGPLAPGLNILIREIVMSLNHNYGVTKIKGMQYGFKGYQSRLIDLDPQSVQNIHNFGGSILGTSITDIDQLDIDQLVQSMSNHQIQQLYVIGGVDEHQVMQQIYRIIKNNKLKISVIGIPVSIEKEYPIFDQTVGFSTAIEGFEQYLQMASIEARNTKYGVVIVKLDGMNCGFNSVYAALSSREVDICIVPEFNFELYGESGLLQHAYNNLLRKKSCVIVINEGCLYSMLDYDHQYHQQYNQDISLLLRNEIQMNCFQKGINAIIKIINPCDLIRARISSSYEIKICTQIAQNAVHGAMAGFTNLVTGLVNRKSTYVILSEILSDKHPTHLMPGDLIWQRVLATTGQPSFVQDEKQIIQETPARSQR